MVSDKRTAIITGGASGMGLAVAHALARAGGWDVTVVDLNADAGAAAADAITQQSCSASASSTSNPSSATFQQADCTEYAALASAFQATFARAGRLDFVYANAGIAERANFYAAHDTGSAPPPPPDLLVSKINLDAIYTTTYLAQHYFRQTPKSALAAQGSSSSSSGGGGDQSIVMTSSSGGVYPSGFCPLYSGAKHGVVGFMRAIAPSFYKNDGIRVNAVCPGPLRTGLLAKEAWDQFDQDLLTDVDKVAAVVLMLIEGRDDSAPAAETRIDDARGVDGGDGGGGGKSQDGDVLLWGNTVEISAQRHYYRDPPRFSDVIMERNMVQCDPTVGFLRT
ncbi:15-hydroxyprostaglandin dehydrogenase (NAD) [Microdochium nivale]|nr:15-hydroxyprostaglandin dehydrogenase (NAD) [Microdochium nivale]